MYPYVMLCISKSKYLKYWGKTETSMSNCVVPIDGDRAVEDGSYRTHAGEGSLMTQVPMEMKIVSRLVGLIVWDSTIRRNELKQHINIPGRIKTDVSLYRRCIPRNLRVNRKSSIISFGPGVVSSGMERLGCVGNHLLTPWSRVLLEKLTGYQLVKFPTLYGTERFITAFTSACHLSLSKVSDQVRVFLCECFVTRYVFTARSCQHLAQPSCWRATPFWLSATAYSIYSQLPSMLEAVPPSATWGRRAMPWWQGPTHYTEAKY